MKRSEVKPRILLPGQYSEEDVDQLKTQKIWQEVDIYKDQLAELLEIRFPDQRERERQKNSFMEQYVEKGAAWVYFPWSGMLIRCLGPDEYFEIRTNRNQNLITADEQKRLFGASIGVAGMSVGSGIAIGSVYSGIGGQVKIADFDVLESANLNRIREGLHNIGLPKAELAAQRMYEINPFQNIVIFDRGINDQNIEEFMNGLDLIIDEIDDFRMKVLMRVQAKKRRIPLLMFTSLGDNILVDVERYDLDSETEIFNGAIGDVADEILNNHELSSHDIKRYAVNTVGAKYVPTRALGSLPEIGRTLVGRPQLYSTVAVDGGLASFVTREIILNGRIKSGRYFINFSELVNIKTDDFVESDMRIKILKEIMANG